MTVTASLLAAALRAAANALDGNDTGTTKASTGTKTTETKTTTAKGPSLEDVQNKIRELVAADEGNAAKVKAEITKLGGKRAGDFEGDAVKLKKLLAALDGIGADEGSSEDDDLL